MGVDLVADIDEPVILQRLAGRDHNEIGKQILGGACLLEPLTQIAVG